MHQKFDKNSFLDYPRGRFLASRLAGVPGGRYALNVWHERCLPENLRALSRQVAVSPATSSLGELRLPESGNLLSKHKNKYSRDYDLAPPAGPTYDQP